jgi:4-hydroxy-2-oxoheptanedioate aldolase
MVVDAPLVGKASEAEAVVYAAKYAPLGGRGFNLGSMGNRYGFLGRTGETPARINAETMVMVQIETVEGVENAEAIAAISSLDLIFIGVGDLSQSLGIPCDWENPKLIAAVERTIKIARKAGKHVCVFTVSPEMGRRWLQAGARMMALASEASMINSGFRQMFNSYKQVVAEVRPR